MISLFKLKNYKSYESAELPLATLTVLIGANASGKSNILEALKLLAWLAAGHKLSEISHADQSVVRGAIDRLGRNGAAKFSMGATIDYDLNHYEIEIELRGREFHISDEILINADGTTLYKMKKPSTGESNSASVAYNTFKSGPNQVINVTDQRAVLTQLDSPASFSAKHKIAAKQIPKITSECAKEFSSIMFLDPVPAKMRGYSFKSDKDLRGDGSNISSVLYNVWENGNPDEKKALLGFVESLPEQQISNIRFISTPRNEVMLELIESFGGIESPYDASLLSDGTLRILSIAAAVLTVDTGSLVVIEEIDNGVHPNRANQLITSILGVAARRQLQILLTTHNPALLDALPLTRVGDVVFCYRDPENGASRLVKIDDLANAPALTAQGPLGQLLTKGLIDRFAKEPVAPKVKPKPSEWLSMLETGGGSEDE